LINNQLIGKGIIIFIGILIVVIGTSIYFFSGYNNLGNIVTTEENRENLHIVYEYNEVTKKSYVEIEILLEDINFSQKLGEKTWIESVTELDCKVYQISFYDKDALFEKFKKLDPNFEKSEITSKDSYDITKAIIFIKNKESGELLSKCDITGKEEGDLIIKYY